VIELEKHVVVIFPHPDDESFGTAGTILKYRSEGVPVTYLCGTSGEMGRNMGVPPFANRETLPKVRKEELIQAANVLDIDLKMLGYRDKTIEFEDRGEIAQHLKSLLEEIEPSLVITHYPGQAVHPDHNALGSAAVEAVRLMDKEKRPRVWAQAIINERDEVLGKPDISIDVTDYIDQKMAAIYSHDSQFRGVVGQFVENEKQTPELDEEIRKQFSLEEFYTWKYDD